MFLTFNVSYLFKLELNSALFWKTRPTLSTHLKRQTTGMTEPCSLLTVDYIAYTHPPCFSVWKEDSGKYYTWRSFGPEDQRTQELWVDMSDVRHGQVRVHGILSNSYQQAVVGFTHTTTAATPLMKPSRKIQKYSTGLSLTRRSARKERSYSDQVITVTH